MAERAGDVVLDQPERLLFVTSPREARAAEIMEAAGDRWTPLRALVIRALDVPERAFTAYDLADALSRHERRRVGVMSVYRTLQLFRCRGIVSRIEGLNAFIIDTQPGIPGERVFLICDRCGTVEQRNGSGEAGRIGDTGFEIRSVTTEVRGDCRRCVNGGRPS